MTPRPRPALKKAADANQHPAEPRKRAAAAAPVEEPVAVLSVRVPRSLRSQLRRAALDRDITVQELVIATLTAEVGAGQS